MAKFRWAYLGCGGIAHTTAKQLKDSADNEIVAVWNRTPKKAEDFVRKFGGNRFELMEYLPDAMQRVGGPIRGI